MDIRSDIPAQDIERYHAKALEFSSMVRSLILSQLEVGFEVKRKSDNSLVTSVDLQVEEVLRQQIQLHFPDHGILGEEYEPENSRAAFQWIMDPIDGTEDMVRRVPTFGSILALHYRGEPVVGVIDHPLLDMRVNAAYGFGTSYNGKAIRLTDLDSAAIDGTERLILPARDNFVKYRDDGNLFDSLVRAHPNHRIYRSCFAHTCAVAGLVDAAIDYGDAIWDIAASRVLIEEASGKFVEVGKWNVPNLGFVYGTVFGKPTLVDRLVEHFRSDG